MKQWIRTCVLIFMEVIIQVFLYTQDPPTRSDFPPKLLCSSGISARPSLSTSALTLCLLRFAQASLPQKYQSLIPFFPTERCIPFRHLPSVSVVMTAIGHILLFSLCISRYFFLLVLGCTRPSPDLLHVLSLCYKLCLSG